MKEELDWTFEEEEINQEPDIKYYDNGQIAFTKTEDQFQGEFKLIPKEEFTLKNVIIHKQVLKLKKFNFINSFTLNYKPRVQFFQ